MTNKTNPQDNHKVCSKNFDVTGLSVCRVGKQAMLTRFFPVGNNISGKPKLKDLCSMWVEHKFGEKIAYVTTRFEKQVHQIRNLQIKIMFKIKKMLGRV